MWLRTPGKKSKSWLRMTCLELSTGDAIFHYCSKATSEIVSLPVVTLCRSIGVPKWSASGLRWPFDPNPVGSRNPRSRIRREFCPFPWGVQINPSTKKLSHKTLCCDSQAQCLRVPYCVISCQNRRLKIKGRPEHRTRLEAELRCVYFQFYSIAVLKASFIIIYFYWVGTLKHFCEPG